MVSQSENSSRAGKRVCPVCHASGISDYVKKNGYRFLRCPDCHFVWVKTPPDPETFERLYDHGVKITADHYPKSGSRRRRALGKAWTFKKYLWRKTALDIGCGGGFVVDAFRLFGADAYGLDVNPNAINYAKRRFSKCHFVLGDFSEIDRLGKKFDFVYSSEVMEHLDGVDDFMGCLARNVKPGGHVFITTPDLAHPDVPEDPSTWNVFSPPFHIQFFDAYNLAMLFGRFGFETVKRFKDEGGQGLQILFRKRH